MLLVVDSPSIILGVIDLDLPLQLVWLRSAKIPFILYLILKTFVSFDFYFTHKE